MKCVAVYLLVHDVCWFGLEIRNLMYGLHSLTVLALLCDPKQPSMQQHYRRIQ